MNDDPTRSPSVVTRRTALAGLGAGALGLAARLAGPALATAQEASPVGSPVTSSGDVAGRVAVGDGRSLYLECLGMGSPTAVLEAAGTTDSSTWAPIWSDVAAIAHVCRYDRVGLGQSDPAPAGVRTVEDSVADLHALLGQAGVPGPYVLVGHSVGGLIVRLYASAYPQDVAGMVLADGQPPDLAAPGLALLPPEERRAMFTIFRGLHPQDPEHLDIIASGVWVLANPSPPVPTVVLAAGRHGAPGAPPDPEFEALWQELQREQADALQARFVPVLDSDHFIHQDRPALVVDAIRQVIEAARHPGAWATTTATPLAGTPAPP
jgi:pimeloyl-ACP methyl ester carboxylesterase